MAHPSLHSRLALALAGALLLGAGAGAGFGKPQKSAGGSPLVDALARLTPAQRSEYLQGLRGIEDSRSAERLQQIDQAQTCLAQAGSPTAVKGCWQSFTSGSQKSRAEQAQQQQALAQRFGLPLPSGGKKGTKKQ